MRTDQDPIDLTRLLHEQLRRAADLDSSEIPAVLGSLERLRVVLWQRWMLDALRSTQEPARDSSDDLRHLTPQKTAELLSLKPAYVHELCRTKRLPAVKSGKYWMIPLAGLWQWLYQSRDVDPIVATRLESVHPRGDTAGRMRRAGRRRQPTAGSD